jgi:fimbrial isopeptide formation D2 family protein/LPXTG-motif cell wall-anchored protein
MRGNNLRQVPWTTTDSNFIHYKWKGEHAMNFKKVASIALAGAMAMSMMAVPAFADGTGTTTTPTPTPIPTNTGKAYDVNVQNHTYNAYQIFTGTQADKNQPLGNVDWAKGVNSATLLDTLKKDTTEYTKGTTVASKFKDCDSAQKVANVLASEPEATQDALARAFAVDVYNSKCLANVTPIALGTESTSTITRTPNSDGTVSYSGSGISKGYYLIEDTTDVTPGTDGTEDAKNLTVLQVADTITIKSKAQYPTIEKKILEDNEEKDVNEASMGENVTYELKSTVPNTKAYTTGYYFYMSDMQSKGLTLHENSFKVTVGGTELPDADYKVTVEKYGGDDKIKYIETTAEYPTAFEINFTNIKSYTAGQAIKVTYTAELNENAVTYPASNPNQVDLHYSNNPNEDYSGGHNPGEKPKKPTGETPWDKVRTYTTGVKLQKTDATQRKFIDALKDAEFTLTTTDGMKYAVVTTNAFTEDNTNGTYYKLNDGTYTTTAPTDATASNYASTTTKYKNATTTNVTSADGKTTTTTVTAKVDPTSGQITFTGLGAGTYTLSETNTPKGYNTAADVTFKISFNEDANASTKDGDHYSFASSNNNVKFSSATNLFETTIENHVGNTLPSTGGIGTRMFYVFGGCLVAAAVALLALKKRREA